MCFIERRHKQTHYLTILHSLQTCDYFHIHEVASNTNKKKVSIYFKKTKYFENITCKTSRDKTALHIPLNATYSYCKEAHQTLQ